ncbi:MAG TPA: cupredoxin domain-containing protein [Anaerolineales bacterium]|nr:cupredoxin domain-containing protein [Anaerolineales bacterium]
MKNYFILLTVIASLAFSSCGGGAPSTSIDVVMTDFQFIPNTFTVPAGEVISVHVVSSGAVVHNFVIMKLGETAGDSFDEDDEENIYWEVRDIPPNGEETSTFTAPSEPGEYQIVCRTEGHILSGMLGKLIVVAGE